MLFLGAAILLAVVTAAAMLSTVPGLQRISLAAVVGASGLLGWLAIRSVRAAAQQQLTSAELRRLNETLETQEKAARPNFGIRTRGWDRLSIRPSTASS